MTKEPAPRYVDFPGQLHLFDPPPSEGNDDDMRCGNDPSVELTAEEQAWVTWFGDWLAWAYKPPAERGPEPRCPNGTLASEKPPPRGHDR